MTGAMLINSIIDEVAEGVFPVRTSVPMIITLDGPAASGKSSVAKAVADRLRMRLLPTGAMYRAVALEALQCNALNGSTHEIEYIAKRVKIGFDWSGSPIRVTLNGHDVTSRLRGEDVSDAASKVAEIEAVRRVLVRQQREMGESLVQFVAEGRDQGSLVFAEADHKFYIDAEPETRARRRVEQLHAEGKPADFYEVRAKLLERDRRDKERSYGPLIVPDGATSIDNSEDSFATVVGKVLEVVAAGVAR